MPPSQPGLLGERGRAAPVAPAAPCSHGHIKLHTSSGATGHKKHDVGIMKLQDGQRPSACPVQTSCSRARMLCRRDVLLVAFQETWGQGSQALGECE